MFSLICFAFMLQDFFLVFFLSFDNFKKKLFLECMQCINHVCVSVADVDCISKVIRRVRAAKEID